MKDEQKVSIIVPCYNAESTIEKCIQSIVQQTYKNIEIIIIDDGSTDNTLERCNQLKQKNQKIKLFSQENKGPSVARNIGIDMCDGDYIMFVDADDWVERECIEQAVNSLENSKSDMVLWNVVIEHRDKRKKMFPIIGNSRLLSKEEIHNIMCNVLEYKKVAPGMLNISITGPVCKLFKKKVIGNTRFREDLFLGEDIYFLLCVLPKVDKIFYMKNCFYHVNSNENSLSQKFDNRYAIRKADFVNAIVELITQNALYIECLDNFIFENYLTVVEKYLFFSKNVSYFYKKKYITIFYKKLKKQINYRKINHKCAFFLKHSLYFPIYFIGKLSRKY